MRRFYLFKRGKNFYCQLKNPQTGKTLPARSTGTSDKDRAEYIANKWYYEGLPVSGDKSTTLPVQHTFTVDSILQNLKEVNPLTNDDVKRFINLFESRGFTISSRPKNTNSKTFISFLYTFWTFSDSPYVKEKLLHGHRITQSYCEDNLRWVRLYWEPYFTDTPLVEISPQYLREFSLHLSQTDKQGRPGETLSYSSINNLLKAGLVPLKWAYKQDEISTYPGKGLMKYSAAPKRRGILADKEIEMLFRFGDWKGNEAARIATLVAYQTGLRAGEIVALRVGDVGADRLFVRHSYNRIDGLKSPKNGETREVPLLPETRAMLIEHAKKNPYEFGLDTFIFFQVDTVDRPIRQETLNFRYKKALESIGIDKDEQKARNLSFHGLRHLYAKKMADRLDQRTMKLTGHKTASMLEWYADHISEEDFKKASKATAEVFGRVLQFKKEDAV